MTENRKMTEEDLGVLVQNRVRLAQNASGSEVSQIRQENLNRYHGKNYDSDFDEEMEGRSKFHTREVLEGVEWAMPSILRAFFSTPKPVEFDPVGPEDEEAAEQETIVVNHVIMERSFLAFYEIIKETLLAPVAYGRVRIQPRDHVEVEEFERINEMDLASIKEEDTVEEVKVLKRYKERIDPLDTLPSASHDRAALMMAGQPVMPIAEVPFYDVRVKYRVDKTEVRIEAVPPEEMLIDRALTSLDMDEADFCAQKTRVSVSDLIEMFPDTPAKTIRENAEMAGDAFDLDFMGEKENRNFLDDEDPENLGMDRDARQPYAYLTEAYIKIDYDRDDYAELRRVMMIGNKVVENEQVPEHPFVAFSCLPLPHRHIGISYAELLKDIQQLATTLTRQMLDSIYSVNRQRKYVNMAAFTETGGYESLENRQSELIEVQGRPQDAVMYEQVQSLTPEIAPVLDAVKQQAKYRTGVAPDIGLDPEVLKKATASGMAGSIEQQSTRLEGLVRLLAETGMKQLVGKVHNALRRHGGGELGRRIRGQYIQRSPLEWQLRYDMTVNVGIGYNSRQQTLDALMQILALMEKAAPYGLTDERGAFRAFKRMVEAMGVGHTTEFFLDPTDPAWQKPEPAPSPDMILAQAELEKAKAQAAKDAQTLQLDTEKMKQQAQLDLQKASMEIERLRLENEKQRMELKKLGSEYELELRRIHLEAAKVRTAAASARAKAELDLANARIAGLEADEETRAVREALDTVERDLEVADGQRNATEAAASAEQDQ